MSVADCLKSGIVCMFTQFSRRNDEGDVMLEFRLPEFCRICPPPKPSSFSTLVEGGAEETGTVGGATLTGDA